MASYISAHTDELSLLRRLGLTVVSVVFYGRAVYSVSSRSSSFLRMLKNTTHLDSFRRRTSLRNQLSLSFNPVPTCLLLTKGMTGNAPFLLSSPLLTLEWGSPPVAITYSIRNHDDPETYTQFREDRPQTPQAQFFMIKKPNLVGYFGGFADATLLEINLFPHAVKAACQYARDHHIAVPCTSILWLVMLENVRDVHDMNGYFSVVRLTMHLSRLWHSPFNRIRSLHFKGLGYDHSPHLARLR